MPAAIGGFGIADRKSAKSALDKGSLVSMQTGKAAPLGLEAEPSAIIKTRASGRVAIGPLGLAGDEQADLRVRGGPEKAAYGYALRHYADWARNFPAHVQKFFQGGVGANVFLSGRTADKDVCMP